MIKGRYVALVEVNFHINERPDTQFNDLRSIIVGGKLTNFIKDDLGFVLNDDDNHTADIKVTQQFADLYRTAEGDEDYATGRY